MLRVLYFCDNPVLTHVALYLLFVVSCACFYKSRQDFRQVPATNSDEPCVWSGFLFGQGVQAITPSYHLAAIPSQRDPGNTAGPSRRLR